MQLLIFFSLFTSVVSVKEFRTNVDKVEKMLPLSNSTEGYPSIITAKAIRLMKSPDASCINPHILACSLDIHCQDTMLNVCAQQNPFDSSTRFCSCFCNKQPCKSNRDCCNNQCNNGACSVDGGLQGAMCGQGCSVCAPEYVCQSQPYANFGYCTNETLIQTTLAGETTTPSIEATTNSATTAVHDTNPYVLACNSTNQCEKGTVFPRECIKAIPSNPSTWFCNCWCKHGYCKRNSDCCNNDCVHNKCSSKGGTQGASCDRHDGKCSSCAKGYTCRTWQGDTQGGYCDYTG